jgi:protein O-mannosyl-transferase
VRRVMDNKQKEYGTVYKALLCAAIAALTLLVYWNVNEFSLINFDDDLYIYNNAMTLRGLSAETIAWAFTSLEVYNWHPLTWLAHMLDIELYGLWAGGHHISSLVLHIMNAVLIFILFNSATRSPWKSVFVALLFALHPMHVESVAWVSERKDVLSLFFMLLATFAYTRYIRRGDGVSYTLVVLLFIFALMTKPIAVVFPLLLFAFDIWPLRRLTLFDVDEHRIHDYGQASWKRIIGEKMPLLALSLGAGIITIIAQSRGGSINTIEALSIWERISHASYSYMLYIYKLCVPYNLTFYYMFDRDISIFWIISSLLILTLVTALSLKLLKNKPFLLSGWMIFVIALLPVIGILQAGAQNMADRYSYIPLIGLGIIAAWGIPALATRLKVASTVPFLLGLLLLAVYSVRAHFQVQTWRDNSTLYSHTVQIDPGNSIAYNNLGTHYLAANKLDSASLCFRNAIDASPGYAMAQYNLGLVYQEQGMSDSAVAAYARALTLQPSHFNASLNRGAAQRELQQFEAAEASLRAALSQQPNSPFVQYQLGCLYSDKDDYKKADRHLRKAIELTPKLPDPVAAYGILLFKAGKTAEAGIVLNKALEMGCDDEDVYIALDSIRILQDSVRSVLVE